MDFAAANSNLIRKFQAKILSSTNFEDLINLELDTNTAISDLSRRHTVLFRYFFSV